ncbi:MAG: ABC-F family ATP-binding cassette domain-containing protein [Methanobacteriota archaeon]
MSKSNSRAPARLLKAQGLDREFDGKRVLQDANFFIDSGEKVGIIGANGSGKTTFLRILAGDVEPDAGTIEMKNGVSVAEMSQHFSIDPSTPVSEALACADSLFLLPEMQPRREVVRLDGETWRKLADRLDVTVEMQRRTVAELSGGERTKVALVRALASARNSDLVLLDEPTSHLDIPTMEWLERAVSGLRCAALVVSHDRYFLDRTVTRIVELADGHLTSHIGNYTAYAIRKEAARREMEARHRKQQAEIERIETSITEMRRRWAYDPGRYRMKEKALERMELVDSPQESKGPAGMDFAHSAKTGREMAVFDRVSFSRDDRKVLENISFTIENGEKVGLIGSNGSGKSTMAKLLTLRLEPDEGRVNLVGKTIPGYFAQEHEGLDHDSTALEELGRTHPEMQDSTITGLLAMMGLGKEAARKTVSQLSGGERAKLALLKLVLSPSNLLVLDEPTNYLDSASREAVEEALLAYEGAILLVTHDRYLLDKVASRIFALDGGCLDSFPGNYSAYRGRRRVGLGKGGRNAYVVVKNYTDWSTRKKYKIGQVLELTPDQEDAQKWAIENKAIVPKEE